MRSVEAKVPAFIKQRCFIQAYKLLRAAAGLFEFVRDHCATFLINAIASPDCNVQVCPPPNRLLISPQQITLTRNAWKDNLLGVQAPPGV
jgi:hypothetical protein